MSTSLISQPTSTEAATLPPRPKIKYLANMRMPTERAHGIQAIEMCHAFVECGYDVEFIVPRRKTHITDEVSAYYQVSDEIKITYTWCSNFMILTWLGFYLQLFTFVLSSWWYLRHEDNAIFYAKDQKVISLLVFFKSCVVWEPHVGDINFFTRIVLPRVKAVIALTNGVRDALVKAGADPTKIHVAHDAVRLEMFQTQTPVTEVRQALDLPIDKKIVLYAGNLYNWKGVDTLAEAVIASDTEVVGVFVGGSEADVVEFKARYDHERILLLGNQPHRFISKYLQAADVLVLPNSGKFTVSTTYTSPLKLFEYMASGRPIIASRLPSLCEVLDDTTAVLVPPDDSVALAKAISDMTSAPEKYMAQVAAATELVAEHTWQQRAAKISSFIEQKRSMEK